MEAKRKEFLNELWSRYYAPIIMTSNIPSRSNVLNKTILKVNNTFENYRMKVEDQQLKDMYAECRKHGWSRKGWR